MSFEPRPQASNLGTGTHRRCAFLREIMSKSAIGRSNNFVCYESSLVCFYSLSQAFSGPRSLDYLYMRAKRIFKRMALVRNTPCTFYGTLRHGEMASRMSKKNLGSSIDDFLKKENIFEETQAQAIKEVVAWQLAKAMKKKKISKARMAVLLKTSRSQVDRILDPKRDITLSSLQRAAALVGQRVVIELV